jgi:hypothetical protein
MFRNEIDFYKIHIIQNWYKYGIGMMFEKIKRKNIFNFQKKEI